MANPNGYGMPSIDFSKIGELGEIYDRAKIRGARGSVRGSNAEMAKQLFEAGDLEGGITLSRLAEAAAARGESRAFRQQQATQAQRNSDRDYELRLQQVNRREVPAGFTQGVNGDLVPIPGGPADPDYQERTANAKAKPRQFNVSDVTKLSEEGGKFSNLAGFADTFDDKFAGYKASALGNAAMTAGRYLPESVVGKDTAEAATWWQGYDRYKNVVRNELFGSALTAPEKAAFEKADINPGMDPEQIKKNLQTQKQVAENGLKRKANALIESGYSPQAIGKAYGLNLDELPGMTLGDIGKKSSRDRKFSPRDDIGTTPPPPAAVDYLRANPRAAEQFDAKYGVGSAARVLGVMR